MKQIVDTGWKEFDKQTNAICAGQGIANTQFSLCIRPWKEKECNGFTNPEGHLMDFDMEFFKKYRIPDRLKQILTNHEREKSVILYMFFATINERIEPFFWVITDFDYKKIDSQLVVGYRQNYMKRFCAAMECLEYITNK